MLGILLSGWSCCSWLDMFFFKVDCCRLSSCWRVHLVKVMTDAVGDVVVHEVCRKCDWCV